MQLALGVNSQKLDLQAYDLRTAILYTLAYSDIFDFPLSLKEIHRYLIGIRATEKKIEYLLNNDLDLANQVIFNESFYALAGRSNLFDKRKERHIHAKELWKQAHHFGQTIARLPFVRMVAVTGALAADNVEIGADLDYLIVTKPGYLWLTRAMILALDRLAARRGQEASLCPNFLITENALALEDRDLFTAQELVRMIPIAGFETYDKIRAANAWTDDFLPNAQGSPNGKTSRPTMDSQMRAISEFVLGNRVSRSIENWEMRRKLAKFSSQQAVNDETRFSADFCKGHFDGHKHQTMTAFEGRIAKLKLISK
jgi:hypothetical protein